MALWRALRPLAAVPPSPLARGVHCVGAASPSQPAIVASNCSPSTFPGSQKGRPVRWCRGWCWCWFCKADRFCCVRRGLVPGVWGRALDAPGVLPRLVFWARVDALVEGAAPQAEVWVGASHVVCLPRLGHQYGAPPRAIFFWGGEQHGCGPVAPGLPLFGALPGLVPLPNACAVCPLATIGVRHCVVLRRVAHLILRGGAGVGRGGGSLPCLPALYSSLTMRPIV